MNKPPFGLTPYYVHAEKRMEDIRVAVNRHIIGRLAVPTRWIVEYNRLLEMCKELENEFH